MAKIVPNRALMVLSKAFLLRFVSPHHPAVQGFVELARPDQPLTNPVIEAPTWDSQRANQLSWPPFIRQETVMLPNSRAWRSHAQLALQLCDRLRAKARGGAGRAKASVGECLGNRDGSPASIGQHLDLVADLRIGTQLAQLANRSDHDPLGVVSADPLNTHVHPFAATLHVYDDPLDQLTNDLFAIGISGGWSSPERGNICRQATNSLSFGFRKEAWLLPTFRSLA